MRKDANASSRRSLIQMSPDFHVLTNVSTSRSNKPIISNPPNPHRSISQDAVKLQWAG